MSDPTDNANTENVNADDVEPTPTAPVEVPGTELERVEVQQDAVPSTDEPEVPPAAAFEHPFVEEILDDERPGKVVTARGVALVGARVAAGVVGIGVAIAAIGATMFVPIPSVTATPPSMLVTPVPTAQQLVCPGAMLRLADETGAGANVSSPLGSPSLRFASSSGPVDATPLASSEAGTGATDAAPTIISTLPDAAQAGQRILISGAQSQDVSAGDFVGLAAAACTPVSGDTWLVGGSSEVGRTTLISLSNPTEVPATVDLEIYGDRGLVSAPGTAGIIVPAGGQRVLPLAGFQPGLTTPVVRVMSTGGQVSASLQQSVVRGLQPGGLEIIGASAAPARQIAIPGVRVDDLAAVQSLLAGGQTFDDVATVLRLFSPSGAEATVSVLPETPTGTGTSFVVTVPAGRVIEIPIDDIGVGSYTVSIDATEPVVAGVRVSTAVGEATDFAWPSSAPLLSETAQFSVAQGAAGLVHLFNPTDAEVTVRLSGGLEDVEIVIPAATAVTLPVVGGNYTIDGFESLAAAITLGVAPQISSYAVQPPGATSGPVTVFP